jgi:hypothetical protein
VLDTADGVCKAGVDDGPSAEAGRELLKGTADVKAPIEESCMLEVARPAAEVWVRREVVEW